MSQIETQYDNFVVEFAPTNRTKISFKHGITVDVPSEQTELVAELRKQAL